jgi:hypothetical protein
MEDQDMKEKEVKENSLLGELVEGYLDLIKRIRCDHGKVIEDNYGETCLLCGQVISGFGRGCGSKICVHKWSKSECGCVCVFCSKVLDL